MLKSIFWLWALLCPVLLFCQKSIGDKIDQQLLQQLMQSAVPSVSVPDYKGKAIIIDFWGTGCGTCLKKMPSVLELQQKFKNEIVFLYAARQDSVAVKKFFQTRPDIKKYTLSMICNADWLVQHFPHEGIPHIIWIGSDLIIKAITGTEELTTANLDTFFKKTVNFEVKKDIPDFDRDFSILKNNKIGESNIVSSSTLLGRIIGLPSGTGVRILDSSRVKVYATNICIPLIYKEYYRYHLAMPVYEISYRILQEDCKDSLTSLTKSYCYEYIGLWNKEDRKTIFERAIKDLDYRFHIKSSIETMQIPCYKFRASKTFISTSNEKSYTDEKLDEIFFVNQPISIIANFIESYFRPDKLIRVVDHEDSKVTLRLSLRTQSFKAIKMELEKIGFHFENAATTTEVIVLRK